ncbi:LOW QUALITY PROTEIN: hypothetical protein HID58_090066, partial [Brassica napus]
HDQISSLLNSTKTFNSLINHLSSHGAHHQVLSTFSSMLATRFLPDAFTFLVSSEPALPSFPFLRSLASPADSYTSSSLVNLYAKFGAWDHARKVFDEMRERDVVHWTAIIGCYSRAGFVGEAFSLVNEMRFEGIKPGPVTLLEMLSGVKEITELKVFTRVCFDGAARHGFMNTMVSGFASVGDMSEILKLLCRMRDVGLRPDHQTFGASLSVSGAMSDIDLGRTLHCQVVKTGFDVDTHLRTALMTMYLKCGEEEASFGVLETIPEKDVVCWTVMISGLVRLGTELSSEAIASVVAACAQLGSLVLGASVHGYTRHSCVKLAYYNVRKVRSFGQKLSSFELMNERDLVSWNAIISGHAQNGDLSNALFVFTEMKFATAHGVDALTAVSLLQACSSAGALRIGRLVHCVVIRSLVRTCTFIDTALVDMYLKCGYLEVAKRCFDSISRKDLVSWAHSLQGMVFTVKGGCYESLLRRFSRLAAITEWFSTAWRRSLQWLETLVLNRITNTSLAWLIFYAEPKEYKEAFKFYNENFTKPSIDVLACTFFRAAMRRWEDVSESWKQMKSLGLKKLPGWSKIVMNGRTTTFFMSHSSHSDETADRNREMPRRQKKTAKVGVMVLCMVAYIAGPSLYWHLNETIAESLHSSCPPLFCDCSSQPLLYIPDGLSNHSFLDARKGAKRTRVVSRMVAEELKLREAQAQEDEWRADSGVSVSEEADKCSMGMETCEQAREKSDATLDEQRRVSYMWELRARQNGWKEGPKLFPLMLSNNR